MKRSFGELELEILRILKSSDKMTVKQVHQVLGEENKYNTIMTVMVRLTEKGVLTRERIGLQYAYWLASPKLKVPSFVEQIKKKFLGIKTTDMISYLIESSEDISEEELEEMEKMIEKVKIEKKMRQNPFFQV